MMAASLAIAGGAALIALWILASSLDVCDLASAFDSSDPGVWAFCPQPAARLKAASASMVSKAAVLSRQILRMFTSSSLYLSRLGSVVAPAFIVPEEELLTCLST